MAKTKFLTMMQTPAVFKSQDPSEGLGRKKSSYIEKTEGVENEWKETFDDWKQELTQSGSILTDSQVKQELL